PALLLLGSKKWWDKKYLEKFGIQTCNLTKKEIENVILECENAVNIVKNEILIRLETEQNQGKKEILQKLVLIFN
ncbi:MAG: type II toxin-antitoxin system HipA family toxin, partial [Aliarcobacter sp.]|nr:type II toxin-antitoxin system HipA family toxin [Aliarcobacter sp.]